MALTFVNKAFLLDYQDLLHAWKYDSTNDYPFERKEDHSFVKFLEIVVFKTGFLCCFQGLVVPEWSGSKCLAIASLEIRSTQLVGWRAMEQVKDMLKTVFRI